MATDNTNAPFVCLLNFSVHTTCLHNDTFLMVRQSDKISKNFVRTYRFMLLIPLSHNGLPSKTRARIVHVLMRALVQGSPPGATAEGKGRSCAEKSGSTTSAMRYKDAKHAESGHGALAKPQVWTAVLDPRGFALSSPSTRHPTMQHVWGHVIEGHILLCRLQLGLIFLTPALRLRRFPGLTRSLIESRVLLNCDCLVVGSSIENAFLPLFGKTNTQDEEGLLKPRPRIL